MKSKKIIIVLIILIIILGGVLAYVFLTDKDDKKLDSNTNNSSDKETLSPLEKKVNEKLESMTLEEKIGQMLIISYRSGEMDDTLKSALVNNKPGGFILFAENFTTYDKTLNLIKSIKETADIPMFMSVDQEGGTVQRLKSLSDVQATKIPAMFDVGKTGDSDIAYQVGEVIGEELEVFGINVDFAPVLDIVESRNQSFIGSRSFGTTPDLVSQMGIQLGKGLEDKGVIPVYKHFPGHGSTTTDSHYDLPVINKTKDELMEKELIPFKKAIGEGADIIMIGHLAIPKITNDKTPASLSKTLITDLLKTELNYQGLVVTDALNMGALTNNYKESEIYEMAINAGVDLLLMPKSSTSAMSSIKASIASGKISEDQINNSVRKILTLKYSKLTEDNYLDKSYLASSEHKKIIEKISVN